MDKEIKSERITLRVTPREKEILEKKAASKNMSVSKMKFGKLLLFILVWNCMKAVKNLIRLPTISLLMNVSAKEKSMK